MNYKRAIGFGIILWILIFVVFSILMFLPFLKDNILGQQIGLWIALAPMTLLLCKWYFKVEPPTIKKGFLLAIIALLTGSILDAIITVPLFAKSSYLEYFGNWKMLVGYAEVILLCIFAGWEFDATFSKLEK